MGVRGHYTFSLTLDKGHFITGFRLYIRWMQNIFECGQHDYGD